MGVRLRIGIAAAVLSALASACTSGTSSDSGEVGADASGTGNTTASSPSDVSLNGRVLSGSTPISGATVAVMAAGISSTDSPTSLTQVTTNDAGEFNASFPCPHSSGGSAEPIYVLATGGSTAGNSGAGNAAIELMAAIGPCDGLQNTLTVNELTTVAAGYSLNKFIGTAGVSGNPVGLANAIAVASLLADPKSGMFAAGLPSASTCATDPNSLNCEIVEKLGALANALHTCTSSGSAASSQCLALLACATPGALADDSGNCTSPPTGELEEGISATADTLEAVLSIARNPGTVAVSGLASIATLSSAYGRGSASPLNDWTLALTFTGGGLSEPTGLAIDASGNAWVANYSGAVTELSATGAPMSPQGGYSGDGLEESFDIAIDPAGNIWVCNEQSGGSVNGGLGTVTKLAPNGTFLSGESGFFAGGLNFPVGLVADPEGHIWVANFGDSTLTELASDGTAMTPGAGYSGGGLTFPVGLSLDPSGDIWVANQSDSEVSLISPEGTALSPPNGFQGGGLAAPQGIALDRQGNAWITNYYGDSVTELDSHGNALSSDSGFTGGGLSAPGSIAIDGAGTIWIANYGNASITALRGAGTLAPGSPLSPASGFTSASVLQPFMLAVDPSGNLWVTNFGNDSVTEFIGIAAPIQTPLIGIPRPP